MEDDARPPTRLLRRGDHRILLLARPSACRCLICQDSRHESHLPTPALALSCFSLPSLCLGLTNLKSLFICLSTTHNTKPTTTTIDLLSDPFWHWAPLAVTVTTPKPPSSAPQHLCVILTPTSWFHVCRLLCARVLARILRSSTQSQASPCAGLELPATSEIGSARESKDGAACHRMRSSARVQASTQSFHHTSTHCYPHLLLINMPRGTVRRGRGEGKKGDLTRDEAKRGGERAHVLAVAFTQSTELSCNLALPHMPNTCTPVQRDCEITIEPEHPLTAQPVTTTAQCATGPSCPYGSSHRERVRASAAHSTPACKKVRVRHR